MTTETSEQTPAQARKARAAEHVQTLTTEREQLATRQRTARAEVERLDSEMAAAVQARDESALAALRSARQGQQDTIDDVGQILTAIDQDLERAQVELRAATIARHAERYNQLVEQQRSLTETIEEAIETLLKAVEVKEGVATKQKTMQTSCNFLTPYPLHSASDPRQIVFRELTARSQQPAFRTALHTLDWSCRRMLDHGDLEQA